MGEEADRTGRGQRQDDRIHVADMVADDESAASLRKMLGADNAHRIAAQSREKQSDNAEEILRQPMHGQEARHEHRNEFGCVVVKGNLRLREQEATESRSSK